jgi:FkbM family methyltransferase
MTFPRCALLILPYTRLELPGWGYLFRLAGAGSAENNQLWADAPSRTIRDKRTHYVVRLDLSNWSERHTYFIGRYYELALQLLMTRLLAPGDRFVDVGANRGAITLCGASLVGVTGRVDSFEPNPECCERIRQTLALNRLQHVRVHPVALSDRSGTMTLRVIANYSGTATLASLPEDQRGLVTRQFEVQVLVGDDVLEGSAARPTLVKIDVEGYELHVLRGLRGTIERWHPAVVTEVQRDWLVRAGTSRSELLEFMSAQGYRAFGLTTRRCFLKHRLHLVPIDQNGVEQASFGDFLWLHPGSKAWAKLKPYVEPDATNPQEQPSLMRLRPHALEGQPRPLPMRGFQRLFGCTRQPSRD